MIIAAKYLNDYFVTIQNNCLKEIHKVKDEFGKKRIHNFRVCVKKINAFENYLKFIRSEFHLDSNALKKIYKTAGKLRTLALIRKELKEIKLLDRNWKKYLSKNVEESKEVFNRKLKKLSKENFKSGLDKVRFTIEEAVDLEKLSNEYLNSLKAEILNLSRKVIEGKQIIHLLRKKFKEFGYNYLVLSDAFYVTLDSELLTKVNKLSKLLGVWHDKTVFKKYISHHNMSEFSDKIAQQTSKEISALLNKINVSLKIFVYQEL